MKIAVTRNEQQRTFLPLLQKAETEIKTLVLVAFLYSQNKFILMGSILAIISKVRNQMPEDIPNKKAYLDGLLMKSDQFIKKYYDKPHNAFVKAKNDLLSTLPPNHKPLTIQNPKQLNDFISNPKNLWAEAKGSPNVVNYPKELKITINRLGGDPMTVYETGKKPITVWQKAELDTRYEHQMQMLQDLRVKGVEYAWISSHANCSKRCEKWQGKLVALNQKSKMSGFRVGKLNGHWVYSLPDIMNQTDKYGYHNNIINGFNCRHRLIPYHEGDVSPKKYTDKEIAKERDIEAKIREMERQIRLYKTQEHLYNKSGDKITAKLYRTKWQSLFEYYKKFCEYHGYAWQEYRIKI